MNKETLLSFDLELKRDGFDGQRAIVLPDPLIRKMSTNPILSTLLVTDIGFFPNAKGHYIDRQIPLSQYVMIYCVDGKGWFSTNNQRYEVTGNQFFILPVGMAHAYGADETTPWSIYWMHFKGTLATHLSVNLTQPTEIRPTPNSRIRDRINLFEEIFLTYEMGYSLENLQYASTIASYFLGSMRFIQQYRQATGDTNEKIDIVTSSIHFMKENIEKRLTLNDLSDFAGYSPTHYSALFRDRTGCSPISYFNQLKIQYACQLIDNTNMKLIQISHKIGFDDCFYFSRLFNNIMGMSPSDYKRKLKG